MIVSKICTGQFFSKGRKTEYNTEYDMPNKIKLGDKFETAGATFIAVERIWKKWQGDWVLTVIFEEE